MADSPLFLMYPHESPKRSPSKSAGGSEAIHAIEKKPTTPRFSSIDLLRTLAIQVMVLVHFCENLAGYTLPITGLGAPLFSFLSGVSYYLWVQGQQARGQSDEDISKVSIRRGLFIFGVGIAFNVFAWFPEGTFNWDVLTLIGSALLVLNLARRLPIEIVIFAAATILLVSPALRIQTDYPAYWQNWYYDYDMKLNEVVSGYFVNGYFPIFPWLAFSLAGFVVATHLFQQVEDTAQDETESQRFPWRLIRVGASLVGVSLLALLIRPYLPNLISTKLLGGWTMFPTTIEYALAMIGSDMILLVLLHHYVDRNPRFERRGTFLQIAKTFSQYSLTIYVLHHLVHLWPLWIYTRAIGKSDPTALWMNATTIPVAIGLAIVFLVACFFLMRWIGPDRRFGIEAWMRWLCD